MTRKQFLLALFGAPLAALGVKRKPDRVPIGLLHRRFYDVRKGCVVNRLEELYDRDALAVPPHPYFVGPLQFHPDVFSFWYPKLADFVSYPKVGETIHVRTPPNYITYRWK